MLALPRAPDDLKVVQDISLKNRDFNASDNNSYKNHRLL